MVRTMQTLTCCMTLLCRSLGRNSIMNVCPPGQSLTHQQSCGKTYPCNMVLGRRLIRSAQSNSLVARWPHPTLIPTISTQTVCEMPKPKSCHSSKCTNCVKVHTKKKRGWDDIMIPRYNSKFKNGYKMKLLKHKAFGFALGSLWTD